MNPPIKINGAANNHSAQSPQHHIQRGETLTSIAQHHNLKVADLLAANKHIKNPDVIQAGQTLSIPHVNKSAGIARPVGTAPTNTQPNGSTHQTASSAPRSDLSAPRSSISDLIASSRGVDVRQMRARLESLLPVQRASNAGQLGKTTAASAAKSNTPAHFHQQGYNDKLPKHSPVPPVGGDGKNRFAHTITKADGTTEVSSLFRLKPGAKLYSGAYNGEPNGDRGKILSSEVKVNFGQRKTMPDENGVPTSYVYALSVRIETHPKHPLKKDEKAPKISASSWIKESDFIDSDRKDLQKMPTIDAKIPPARSQPMTFTISGGDINYTHRTSEKLGDLKVVPHYTGSNRAATDYIGRPGKVVNLLLNLPGKGGVSTDTVPVGGTFHLSGKKSEKVPLYEPGSRRISTDSNGKPRYMRFLYGHVDTPSGRRYGWIARDALKKN